MNPKALKQFAIVLVSVMTALCVHDMIQKKLEIAAFTEKKMNNHRKFINSFKKIKGSRTRWASKRRKGIYTKRGMMEEIKKDFEKRMRSIESKRKKINEQKK
jgi:hypothetical protein